MYMMGELSMFKCKDFHFWKKKSFKCNNFQWSYDAAWVQEDFSHRKESQGMGSRLKWSLPWHLLFISSWRQNIYTIVHHLLLRPFWMTFLAVSHSVRSCPEPAPNVLKARGTLESDNTEVETTSNKKREAPDSFLPTTLSRPCCAHDTQSLFSSYWPHFKFSIAQWLVATVTLDSITLQCSLNT